MQLLLVRTATFEKMQRTTQRTMQGEVFVPAILEPLRDCGMCLESKRAVVCVNQEARRIFTEHLREHALDVDWGDCTLSNARFVVESGVQIAVQGERLLPVMSRTFFKKNIRLKKNAIEMRPAAAFFLGHILAKQVHTHTAQPTHQHTSSHDIQRTHENELIRSASFGSRRGSKSA